MKIVNSFGFCGYNYLISTNGKEYFVGKQKKDGTESVTFIARGFKNEQEAMNYINDLYDKCVPNDEKHLKENKNMKKQTIRLNESQLRQMIAEAINELDWKTYNNAAMKSDKKTLDIASKPKYRYKAVHEFDDDDKKAYIKNSKRSHEFADAAKRSFDRDFGYSDDSTEVTSSTDYVPMLNGVAGYENGGKWRGKWNDIDGDYESYTEPNIGARFYGKTSPDTVYNGGLTNKKAKDAYDKAKGEMSNYYKGNYDYDNERGWHLKDDKLEESIKRSIRKYLR